MLFCTEMSPEHEVIPSEEARRRLPELLRSFGQSHAPRYVIGRHRRPEAVLLGVEDFERLLERTGGEAEGPVDLLRARRSEVLGIAERHGAHDVRVFGSVARGDAGPESDIDLLVRLEGGRTLLDLGGLLSDLQELLGRRVDVVSEAGLREPARDRILREAVSL